MAKKKVLITGGSGFLGINLIRFLLKKNYQITSIDIVSFDYPEKNKIKHIVGDIRKTEQVKKAMDGADYVIHCAAALPLYSTEDIFSTEVKGTEIVLKQAYKNKLDRVIYISSTAVYGVPDHHPVKEDSKLVGVGDYGEAKIKAEKVCQKFQKKGMCISIIRPKTFVGPERLGVFALLYEWAKDGHNFPILGSGDNLYQLLDVADLCQAIYLCMIKPKNIVNDVFNIGAEKFSTIKQDFQVVLSQAGFSRKIISIPVKPAILCLKALEKIGLSPLYQWIYETVDKDSYVSIEKAQKKLGFKPKYSNQQALIRNFKWYLKNYQKFDQNTGLSHRVPWKQGLLKIAKLCF